jgi:hypothetical protein
MINKVQGWLKAHEILLVAFFVLLFILIRLPGRNLPLHQDEYKWPLAVNPAVTGVIIPHPPLGELIYRTAGNLVGFDVHFRLVPIFFGTINLVLLYYLMRISFGRREAVIASFIWIFSYFSVLASLMVDTDGEVMPFFFLLSLIAYHKFKNSLHRKKILWAGLTALFLLCGILVKLSFILAIGAIVLDFLWSKKGSLTLKTFLKYIGFAAVASVGLIVLAILANKLFSFSDFGTSVTYWEHFFTFNRGWFQTAIQCVKALLYTSPFLVFVPFFGFKENFSRLRVFVFFLILAFVFYIVLFDFSIGALDRYLQLLVLPLTAISAVVVAHITKIKSNQTREFLLLGIIVGLILVLLQSLPQYVPSLYPKAQWVSRVLSFKWNFLYPFSGGSGPLGFYISFLFIALSWIVSVAVVLIARVKPEGKKLALVFLIPIGIMYNGMFIEEYLLGHWNGFAPQLVYGATEFIKNNPEITQVTVYNDNGGNEIQATGKYHRRLYTAPYFTGQLEYLNQYKEFYFVLDVPRIDPDSFYIRYFDSCKVAYGRIDKKMSATIYDCRNAPDVTL